MKCHFPLSKKKKKKSNDGNMGKAEEYDETTSVRVGEWNWKK